MVVSREALEWLGTIVRAAGDVILGHYDGEASASLKADCCPVTEADRAAHRTIVAALPEWDPTVPVVSEEGDIPPYEDRRQWRQFWLVDPLDGTKEFLERNGEFTVNAALIEDGRPVLGAVYAPALDRLYLAGRGLGAWKREGGRPPVRLVSTLRSEGAPLVVVESRSHPSPELEEYLRTVSVARRVQIGSSLKFCLVAEAAADVYPRFGQTMEWDTAAGDCVYRFSGRDGERQSPLRYNTPQLRQERFVIGA